MTRGIICVDLDGVLTRDQFSRFGGLGPAGKAIWWGLRKAGVAERLMREAVPDTLAREWLWHLRTLGFRVAIVTARQERYRQITEAWLTRHCFEYDQLAMRQPGEDLLAFKVGMTRRSAGCVLMLDDTHEICREIAKLGDDAPVVLECRDWRIVATVLAALTREA